MKNKWSKLSLLFMGLGLLTSSAFAGIDTGDTSFVLISSALVMLMTLPGLAFFYGGLVRKKNVLSILGQCFAIMAIISVQWVLFGYSLAFGPTSGQGGLIANFWGGLQWFGLHGVGQAPYADYSATIPHLAFMIFQAMFAIITPALIIGAFAERMKLSAVLLFTLIWSTFVYDPVCHWVWGMGGFLRNMGALDFAGGTVVHIISGVSALVLALMLGKRKNVHKGIPPHNLPFTVLGAGLLWFGWFGFNAGSALGANGLAASAFVATHIAAAAATLTYALIEWIFHGKPTVLGMSTGAVAGLVAITPAAGFVNVPGAIIIGGLVSVVCYIMISFIKSKLGYDDSLDAFGVHGMGGIWGAIATGLFATKAVNAAGNNGLFYGNTQQLFVQLTAIGVVIVYAVLGTLIIAGLLHLILGGLRVTEKDEDMGLDLTENHETAYTVLQ